MSGKPREVYPPTHIVSCSERSNCPYFELRNYEEEEESSSYCVAYCRATERYLTKSFIKKCIVYWESCPYRYIADSQLS